MSFLRNTLFIGALLLAGSAHATDVDRAGGSVSFHAPDHWLSIMEIQGDPEVRVFQVPDPSPTASSSLARVSVTVKQVGDLNSFQQYVSSATLKAKALTGYAPGASADGPNSYRYTARENGAQFSYSERYWFHNNHAIQLRCVRPVESQAGKQWGTAFDQGCDAIAASLKT